MFNLVKKTIYNSSFHLSLFQDDQIENHVHKSFYLNQNYTNAIEMFSQKKYRKVLSEIKRLDKIFYSCSSYWKVTHLKIKCIEKIIEKKLKKCAESSECSSIAKWFEAKEYEMDNWYNDIITNVTSNEFSSETKDKIELLITFNLNQCLHYAKYCIHKGHIKDSIAFLAFGEKLFKKNIDYITSPDSLYITEEIFLFLSSLLITNEDFSTAQKYLITVLKLSFKELELRGANNDFNQEIVIFDGLKSDERIQIKKIFFNITTTLYQLGVCYENEGRLSKAHQAYKQSLWFARSFEKRDYPGLIEILTDLKRRMLMRINLIHYFRKKQKKFQETITPKNTQTLLDVEANKIKRFEELTRFLEGIKLHYIDDEDPDLLNEIDQKPMSERVNVVTKTVHLLNHLMSSKFKDIINQMKKIELETLSSETKKQIQKRIVTIKNKLKLKISQDNKRKRYNKSQSLFSKAKQYIKQISIKNQIRHIPTSKCFYRQKLNLLNEDDSSVRNNKTKEENNKLYKQYNSIQHLGTKTTKWTTETTSYNYTTNGPTIYNNTTSQSSIQSKPISTSRNLAQYFNSYPKTTQLKKSISKSKALISSQEKPESYQYSKYVFNSSFRKKINFLEKKYEKELLFQKELLKCKRAEVVQYKTMKNETTIMNECDNFYKSTLKKEKYKILNKHDQDQDNAYFDQIAAATKAKLPNIPKILGSLGVFNSPSICSFLDSTLRDFSCGNKTNLNYNKLYLTNLDNDLSILKQKKNFLKRQQCLIAKGNDHKTNNKYKSLSIRKTIS